MAAAQRARWAKLRSQKHKPAAPATKKLVEKSKAAAA
jgi:hypothetical protein